MGKVWQLALTSISFNITEHALPVITIIVRDYNVRTHPTGPIGAQGPFTLRLLQYYGLPTYLLLASMFVGVIYDNQDLKIMMHLALCIVHYINNK